MNKSMNIRNLTLVAMGISLNVIGALIALTLRLPIYLDSIGTILIACLLGSKYAVMTGVCGSLVSGFTFDPYSIYFAPVQLSTGLLAGLMYNKGFLKGKILAVSLVALGVAVLPKSYKLSIQQRIN